MIYDRMERLTQYRGLNANLDKLIDYVLTHDFDSLVTGKNDVDAEAAWVAVVLSVVLAVVAVCFTALPDLSQHLGQRLSPADRASARLPLEAFFMSEQVA